MALAYGLGARVRRREDPRLITGAGTYLDDVRPSGLCHLVFLRSYLPHALVRSADASVARSLPGVIAVVTAAELEKAKAFPQSGPKSVRLPVRPVLNGRKVCFAGDLIGFVIAGSIERAQDTAESVVIDLEPLEPVMDPQLATQPGTRLIHEDLHSSIADES